MTSSSVNSSYQHLELSNPLPHVFMIALNRPRKRNAMNAVLWKEIGHAFSHIPSDMRCVILKGNGMDFTSGLDVTDPTLLMSKNDNNTDVARQGMSFRPKIGEMQDCISAIEKCPIPVIAMIHGNCIGAGVDMMVACDIRLAASNTVFSIREVKLGLAADIGTLQRLPKGTGNASRVYEYCLTGETFGASEAMEIGLISRVVQSISTLEQDALLVAQKIAANSPVAVRGTKASLIYSRDHTVQEGLDHIANHNALALMTDDLKQSFVAARTKQRPTYGGFPPPSRL